MRSSALPWLLGLAVLAVFAFVSLRHLDTVPQVYEDEPWQASTAYKLLTEGVFGSDLFAGFHAVDQRYYGFMPLHPLLLAATFRLLGVGLAQARLETVVLTALTLLLTFALGVRLFHTAWVGALAVALLVFGRWSGLTYVQLSGIPVVDLARIARYDPLVPVIGLAALHLWLSVRGSPDVSQRGHSLWDSPATELPQASSPGDSRVWLSGAAGLLAGLAGLAHVYGLFWVPALLLLSIWDRQPKRVFAAIAIAAVLPWLPYAAYVLSDVPDWRGQTAIYASRFALFDPRWYVSNLAQEYHRYGPGLGPFGAGWLVRPGFFALVVALPVSLGALGRRALACDAAARAIVVPAVLFPILFALTITLKLVNYTLIELPLFALATGWGIYAAWSRAALAHVALAAVVARLAIPAVVARVAIPAVVARLAIPAVVARLALAAVVARVALVAIGAAVLLEGGAALVQLHRAAATTTPYPTFIAEIRAYVPPGARVLGLHSYWLGMQDFSFRSFVLPLNWADEGVPLDKALNRVAPDIVLLDARMRAYFDSPSPEVSADRVRFYGWLDAHGAQLIGRVDDPTYGLIEIYRVNR